MKKICLITFFCLCLSSAFAGAGIGVKYGAAPADTNVPNIGFMDKNQSSCGFEFFLEKETPKDAFGFRIGFNKYGDIETTGVFERRDEEGIPQGGNTLVKFKNELYTVPVTVYYKYKAMENFYITVNGGITYGYSSWSLREDDSSSGFSVSSNQNDSKLFPHIGLGAEWRANKNIGVGLDITYNFQSKIYAGNLPFYISIDGLQGNIAARYYF